MKSTTIFILLFLFPQFLVGQNNCGNFKDYENSQLWIKEISFGLEILGFFGYWFIILFSFGKLEWKYGNLNVGFDS